ncbi:polyphosphate kinase 2 family protein [Bifidobacterium animalis subsp. lactis CECT 8145]|nr:polyphosphate kinase 2 family protein [Bifidobacterium animalis subsp. lactis CECT 8145]
MAERLAREAKSSETLSAVWSLPPAQLLRFHSHTHLVDIDAGSKPGFDGDQEAGERFIADSSSEIANYQRLMYANGIHGDTHRVLIVLQGMDASGKGGIVRHVFSQVDPMGIHYHGFGKPSEEDLAHDYLWRIRRELPSNGWISIFDRSQYEDIVMPRITGSLPEETWRARYGQINDFEAELAGSGCAIIKIFLVSSRQAQRQHFLRRLDDPTRYWKFDPSDLEARDRWDDYMAAWQEVFERTSTSIAPWYLIPADKRWYSRMVVSELLRTTMKNFNQTWPPLDADRDEALARLGVE